jgi:hypothetical protein
MLTMTLIRVLYPGSSWTSKLLLLSKVATA